MLEYGEGRRHMTMTVPLSCRPSGGEVAPGKRRAGGQGRTARLQECAHVQHQLRLALLLACAPPPQQPALGRERRQPLHGQRRCLASSKAFLF